MLDLTSDGFPHHVHVLQVELSTKRCRKARQLSLQDFVNKMEFKRKCFLGHKPDKIKEGKLANKKRMESSNPKDGNMKDLKSSLDALGTAVEEGTETPSVPVILPPANNSDIIAVER